jgi:hypothetical protein
MFPEGGLLNSSTAAARSVASRTWTAVLEHPTIVSPKVSATAATMSGPVLPVIIESVKQLADVFWMIGAQIEGLTQQQSGFIGLTLSEEDFSQV